MVVFEHDAVEKAESMIPSATLCDGIFFECAPAGGGFSGIEQSGGRISECGSVSGCFGGDSAQVLEEVEEDSLRLEDGGGGTFKRCERIAGFGFGAVDGGEFDFDASAVGFEDDRDERQAADLKRVAGDQFCGRVFAERESGGGDIACS